MAIHGANTLEHSRLWGRPNHTLGGSGTGSVIRHNVLLNGQDSIYYERSAFDDLTVEHNLLFNSALFWVSNNGKGGVAPKSWRFRYNVLPAITYDDKTYPSVAADCNVYIPSSSASTFLMKVTGTDGRRGFDTARLRTSRRTPLSTTTRSRCRRRSGPTARCSGGS